MNSQIKVMNLKKYLQEKDWQISPINQQFNKITKTIDNEQVVIQIPIREDLPDYNSRIKDVIGTISLLEDLSFAEVYDNIRNIGYDLMKIRFEASKTSDGTIPLNDFVGAINNVRKMLTFGACSEIQEKSQYRKPFNDAQDLIESCEFAQTEAGSFVISIRIPLGKTYLIEIDEDNTYLKDLGRKTITRIVDGIKEAEELNIESEEIFRENYNKKLNRNVCEAISKILMEEEGFNVDINVKWDSTEGSEENLPTRVEVKSSDHFKKFNKMASYLKKIPEEENITVIGIIKKLQRQEVDQNTEKKLITLDVLSLKRKIYVYLNDDDHREACNAYREGQRVSITGLLNKKTQHWFLDNPRGFKILETN